MKSLTPKKPSKDQREKVILFGLIELYLQSGKPIGSNTLRENGFESLSSATIRNYFVKLEEEGYLKQQHSSGGRVPSSLAFKLYAQEHLNQPKISPSHKKEIEEVLGKETREVAAYLQRAAESVSEITQCATFLSAPRFDQDFILEIKLLGLDSSRLLCAILTDFGLVHTELLHIDRKLSGFTLKRLEAYFNFRQTGIEKPKMDPDEETLGAALYKELLLRHIVSHTHFSSTDLTQAGFSKLLNYPDFNEASALASGLSLFENKQMLRALLSQACHKGELQCYVADDLHAFAPEAASCSVITVPYRIHQTISGAIGILGPNRIPYRELYGQLEQIARTISDSLTKSIYKYKISFRNPKTSDPQLNVDQSQYLLLEDRRDR